MPDPSPLDAGVAWTRDNWFRNTSWDELIERAFQQRLNRARQKPQYLRIQASYLVERHPEVALRLLKQYFALGTAFDAAQAYVEQARAMRTLDDVDGALISYEAALECERKNPNYRTQASLDYVCLIVNAYYECKYQRAFELLSSGHMSTSFPVERYRANGAMALLLYAFGREEDAKAAAVSALAAADEVQSGFRHHQQLGLVTDLEDEFGQRVQALAR